MSCMNAIGKTQPAQQAVMSQKASENTDPNELHWTAAPAKRETSIQVQYKHQTASNGWAKPPRRIDQETLDAESERLWQVQQEKKAAAAAAQQQRSAAFNDVPEDDY